MSRRARAPRGGRPTRRIARSCSSEASGISEKSIFRGAAVRRALLATRPACADEADRFDMTRCPQCVGHDDDVAEYRPSETKKPSFLYGVSDVRTIQGVRIAEHRGGLLECDAMFGQIRPGLLRVSFEHLV